MIARKITLKWKETIISVGRINFSKPDTFSRNRNHERFDFLAGVAVVVGQLGVTAVY